MKYIVFDTETTCLDTKVAEIWQFSGKVIDFDNKTNEQFDYHYRTKNNLSFEARVKCDITQEDVDKFPEFNVKDIEKNLELDNDSVYYIGHNVCYDREVILNTLEREGILDKEKHKNLFNSSKWIDTLRLAKHCYGDRYVEDVTGKHPLSFALAYLFHYLHLYKEGQVLEFHNSMFDVNATWELFKNVCKQMNYSIDTDVKSIVAKSNSLIMIKIFNFGKYKGELIREVYNRHTKETDSYFRWLACSEMCNSESPEYNKDLYYTLEQL